jgi:putative inorganic carbon (HCO3(-)) transporter
MATAPQTAHLPSRDYEDKTALRRSSDTRLLLLILLPVGAVVAVGAILSDKPQMAVALFLGMTLFIASGMRLELLLAAMIANLLMGSARVFEGSSLLNLNRLLGVVILVGLLLKIFLIGAQRLNRTPLNLPVAGYAIAVMASIFFAQYQGIAFAETRVYLRIFILFVLVANLVPSRGWLRFYLFSMIGAGMMLVAVSATTSYNVYAGRVGGLGSYSDYNFYGLVVAVLAPLAVWGFRCEPSPALRLFHLLGFVVLLTGLAQSQSRGAMLALFCVAILMIMTGQLTPKVVLPAIVLGILALPFASGKLIERFTALTDVLTKPPESLSQDALNVVNRLNYIRAGFPMFLEHPITGVGVNNFGAMYLQYLPRSAKERRIRAPHNTWLQVLSETGLLGFIPFVFLLYGAFHIAWGVHRRTFPTTEDGQPNPQADPLLSSVSLYLLYALACWCIGATFVAAVSRDIVWLLLGLIAALPPLLSSSPPEAHEPPPARF